MSILMNGELELKNISVIKNIIDNLMKDKSIKIVIALFLIIAAYFLFYLEIHIKAEEQDFKTFEVVNGLVGLLLTAVASIFVYNTYKAQKEQIDIQRDEILRNQKDIEFNRLLDIMYQHSTKTIKDIEVFRNKEITTLGNNKTTYDKAGFIFIQHVNAIYNQINNNPHIDIYYPRMSNDIIPNYKHLLYSFNTDIKKILTSFNIYNDLIHKNNTLDKTQKNILINIVKDLFYDDFVEKYIPLEATILQLYNNNIKESMDKYNNIEEIILDIQNLVTAIEQNKIEVNNLFSIID